MLFEYGITKDDAKYCAFTTDYGANIIAASNLFYEANEYPGNKRMGCFDHRINAILRTGWSDTERTHDKALDFRQSVAALVQYSKHSKQNKRTNNLQSKLSKTLKKMSPTRWNSFYFTLNSISESFGEIEDALRGIREIRKLTCIDRYLLDSLTSLLKVFKDMSVLLESESTPTMHYTVLSYYKILDVCQPGVDEDPIILSFRGQILHHLREKVKLTDECWISVFLNPLTRALLMLPQADRVAMRAKIIRAVEAWCPDFPPSSASAPSPADVIPAKRARSDLFDSFMTGGPSTSKDVVSLDEEVAHYESLQIDDHGCVLNFFKSHEKQLPRLSLLARRIFVVPATSSASERIFSASGMVVDKKRSSIKPAGVDAILRTRSALKNGFFLE